MKLYISIFFSGLLFGAGLAISGMTDPARIAGFLDIAGNWDMTLMFVMGTALLISLPGFYLLQKKSDPPWFAEKLYLPARKDLDVKLVLGAIIFGIGWGISGLCPGPAIGSLVTGASDIVYFILSMILGQNIVRWFEGTNNNQTE